MGLVKGGVVWALLLILLAGCGELLYEEAAPAEPALLTLEYTPQLQGVDGADGTAAAFAAVDQAHIQLVSASGGGATVVDETFVVSSQGGEIRVQVEVELEEAGTDFIANVVLRGGGSALFEGGSEVVMEPGATVQADLSLTPVPAGLRISPEALEPLRSLGETLQLAGHVVFATGDPIPGRQVAWESTDPGVASVSAAGEVTAVGAGTATIRATHQDLSDQVEVEVDPEPATIEVEPAESEIGVGQTVQLSAVVRDGGGSRLDVEVEWTSSDETVASVNESGLVTGVGEGTASIEARAGDLTGSAQVEVEVRVPTVETVGATAIGTTQARIRGNVNPSGLPTQVWFEWGRESDLSDATQTDPTTLEASLSTTLVGRDLRELEDGTTFYFRALAENDAGQAAGEIRSFETSLLVPVPTNLQVEVYFGEGVVAEWSYDTERFSDATFELQMREADPEESEWETVATTDETIAFLEVVLESDVTYQFRVRACRSDECSDWSALAEVLVDLPAPTGLQITQMEGWTAEWNYDVEAYPGVIFELQMRESAPEETEWATIETTESTLAFLEELFIADVTYEFRVRACLADVCSGWSATADLTLELPAPTNLQVGPDDMDTWAEWDYDLEEYPSVYFELEIRRAEPGAEWEFLAQESEGTGHQISSPLTAEVTYEFRVRACEWPPLCSGWSNVDDFTMDGGTAPFAATRPSVDMEGGEVVLRGDISDGGMDTEYWFEWGDNDGFADWETTPVRTVEREAFSMTGGVREDVAAFAPQETHRVEEFLTGLTPGQTYYYHAVAENSQGQYVAFPVHSFTAGEVPDGPTEVTISQFWGEGSEGIEVDAEIPAEPTQANRVEIERQVNGGGWELVQEGFVGLLPFIDEGVQEGSSYAYRLRACWTDGGCSDFVLSDPEAITWTALPPAPEWDQTSAPSQPD